MRRVYFLCGLAPLVLGLNAPADQPPGPPELGSGSRLLSDFPGTFLQRRPEKRSHARIVGDTDQSRPSWRVSSWTADWYSRAEWEKELGPDFYKDGVFDRRYGGDLQGVINKLDYLSDLGVNTLYFNPLFDSRSLHKYDGNSYHHIDPFFGPDPQDDLKVIDNEDGSDPTNGNGPRRTKRLPRTRAEIPRTRNARDHRRRFQPHRSRFLRIQRHPKEPAAFPLSQLVCDRQLR